ncbi:MAG: sugar ABC transporter permease [Anaerolineaceae bacterium]|nr:sugar ABC transporter permease [Anaerolineaceae bacterium]
MQKNPSRFMKRFEIRKSLPFWLILPSIIVILIVQVYPAFYTLWLSLQERKGAAWEYVGFENFERLVNAGLFPESIGHTVIFLLGYVVLTLSLGFIIAQLLKRNVPLTGLYVTILFVPWIIADIIAGLVFRLLVTPDYGLFSGILAERGISVLTDPRPSALLGEFPFPPSPAMVYLILAATWRALPFITLLLLASLQTIPHEVIESARIDGANGWQITNHITIPLILPTMVVALFNLILGGMNGVGMVFSLTGGGPGTATYVLSYFLYVLGWGQLRFGRAAALALMIAIVNWILIYMVLRVTKLHEKER